MKIRITFLSLLAVSAAMVASAQVVEYDDMYFNSKDRTRVQASKPLTLKNINTAHEAATIINPTDSYSARNVNPEYISQSTVNPSGSVEKAPYFIPDYTPTAINQNLNSNSSSGWNNCNCASTGNPSYGMMPGYGGYGSPYNSFYPSMSGMYGYNPYSYGGYNGFNSGWSSMLSIGLGMGMGGYYPYGGMGTGMSPYLNYGMNYYGGYNNYYPNNVMVINNDHYNNNVAYGKRSSRSSDLSNSVNSQNRSTPMISSDSQGRVRSSGGRVAGDGDTNSNSYYQRGWRSNPETNSAARTSSWSSPGRTGSESGSSNGGFFNNSGNTSRSSSYDNNSSRTSGFGGGNSSSNFSSGGGSRSSGSGGGSSGSSRGRD